MLTVRHQFTRMLIIRVRAYINPHTGYREVNNLSALPDSLFNEVGSVCALIFWQCRKQIV